MKIEGSAVLMTVTLHCTALSLVTSCHYATRLALDCISRDYASLRLALHPFVKRSGSLAKPSAVGELTSQLAWQVLLVNRPPGPLLARGGLSTP